MEVELEMKVEETKAKEKLKSEGGVIRKELRRYWTKGERGKGGGFKSRGGSYFRGRRREGRGAMCPS